MRVEAAELIRVEMPLLETFRTANEDLSTRSLLLLRLHTDEGEGWGECSALPAPSYVPEYLDGEEDVLRKFVLPTLLAKDAVDPDGLAGTLKRIQGHSMAKAAAEMAVLDAHLRAGGVSLAEHLGGGERDRIEAGVTLGIEESVEQLVESAVAYVARGYRAMKLKIRPGWDLEPLSAVREAIGPDVKLMADANGSYSGETTRLRALSGLDLLLIEQPLPPDRLVEHAELARELAIPICLDESILSLGNADDAMKLEACRVINIKAARVGGLTVAKHMHDLAADRGVAVRCGGLLESALGRAANTALGSLPNFTYPPDLAASDRYFARDIAPSAGLDDGYLPVPKGPGIGVDLDEDALDAVVIARELITR